MDDESESVLILGAGLVGPVMALQLARRGYRVDLVEASTDPRRGGSPQQSRSINLTLAERGWHALNAVGLADKVRALTVPLEGRLIHEPDGTQHFQPYGPRGEATASIIRARLHALLLDSAEAHPAIRLRFNQRCIDIDLERSLATFTDGETGALWSRAARPIVAADGANSVAHRALERTPWPVRREPLALGYKELRIPTAGAGPALQRGALHLWPRGQFFIVAFPNPDGSFSASLFMPDRGEVSFESLSSPERLTAFLRETAPDLLPRMPTLVDDFFRNPLGRMGTLRSAKWAFGNRLVLIGDAAHAIVPFLGQGMNAGLEDTVLLAQSLDAAGGDWGTAMAAFEQQRKRDCDDLADLACEHFVEISESVRDPEFQRRKRIERKLNELFPDLFIPLYSLITFTRLPYRDARLVAASNDAVVTRLMSIPGLEQRWDEPEVRELAVALLRTTPGVWHPSANEPPAHPAEIKLVTQR